MFEKMSRAGLLAGPLIMVVAFVGFLGGWTHQVPGIHGPFLSGALAATIVTLFTFLPSFVFILAGGPIVESTHDRRDFTAPLAAITAAVVGVIVNLGLFFAAHVWWPQGIAGAIDLPAVALTLVAVIALIRFRVGVIPLLLACALVGLLLRTGGALGLG